MILTALLGPGDFHWVLADRTKNPRECDLANEFSTPCLFVDEFCMRDLRGRFPVTLASREFFHTASTETSRSLSRKATLNEQ